MGAHEGLPNIRLIKILKQISTKNLKQNSRAKPEPAAVKKKKDLQYFNFFKKYMITIMFVYEACVWVHMVVGGQGYFLRVIHFFQFYVGSGNGWAISPIPKYIELLNTWMWFSMKKESRINSLKIETCPYDHIFNFSLYKTYERKKMK